jgi:glycosyltransferase 2 family protein
MQAAIETPTLESNDSRPLKLRILRVVPVVLILGLLVHLLLPRLGTITDSLETLRSMAPWAIAMAVFMESLSYVANGALLQSIVGLTGDRITLRRAAAIEIGAGTVALVAAGRATPACQKTRQCSPAGFPQCSMPCL